MKLNELFAKPVAEDNRYIGNNRFPECPEFDPEHSRPLGTFNGLTIWGSRYGSSTDIYGVIKNGNPVAWCAFDTSKNPGTSTWIRAWVDQEHRGKDLTLCIINFITAKNDEKITIDKDEQTSSASRGLLKKWMALTPQSRLFSIRFVDDHGSMVDPEFALSNWTKNDVHVEIAPSRTVEQRFGTGKHIIPEWVFEDTPESIAHFKDLDHDD